MIHFEKFFNILKDSRIAIVGGGAFCKTLLELFFSHELDINPEIVGVADPDIHAPGLCLAKEKGIFTTTDYQALCRSENIDLIIEITRASDTAQEINKIKAPNTLLVDYSRFRALWDLLQIEKEKKIILPRLKQNTETGNDPLVLFRQFSDCLTELVIQRNRRSHQIEQELVEQKKALAQIIQGSTMPTFVINRDHVVTHWNSALEKLTGFLAYDMVGTDLHWAPFRRKKRPIMADVILDQFETGEISKYYGKKWRKSALINDAYEAEEFFSHLGDGGKWLYFTAAPIKANDGTLVGAIETLIDKTEEKQAQYERDRHTAELAEREKTLSQIIQGSTMPTFVINKDHIVTHWNLAMEKLSGCPASEMVGTNRQWAPFWDRERPAMADVILDRLSEEEIRDFYGESWRKSELIEGAYEAEIFFPTLGKEGKWCWFTASPIMSADGEMKGAIETLWDKTADKKAQEEQAVRTRELAALCSIYASLNTPLDLELRLRAVGDEISRFLKTDSVCIFMMGDDGQFYLKFSSGLMEHKCTENEINGIKNILYEVAQQEKPTFYKNISQGGKDHIDFIDNENIQSLAYIPISSKDKKSLGILRIGSRSLKGFSPEEKNILELIGNRIAVAVENSLLHDQYMRSEEKYRSLFNNNPNPIFIIDSRSLEILDTNNRAQQCYGYTRGALFKLPFLSLGDEDDSEILAGLTDLSPGQSVFFSKKRHYKKNGLPLYVNINVSFASYGDNHVIIAATTDITEIVEKETQLIQAGKMTTLGQMAAGIAHEINQPLNVIQVCADYVTKMIKKGQPVSADELKLLANDISENVERAAGIIRHMRDFSRQSPGVRQKIVINDPVNDVFKVLGHQIKIHNISVDLDLDPEIPYIMAEHNRLEQVFLNLVINAIDAIDEKCAKISEETFTKKLKVKSFFKNRQVFVTVEDTGIGMPEEIIDKIFDPFFTTKEVGKGTGLGVSISYGIVKEYGGTISIQSTLGEGTAFTVMFPAVEENSNGITE